MKTQPPQQPDPVDWLTLAQCADDVNVPVETVRQWCLRHERGEPGGLACSHFGELPPDQAARKNRRVRRSDWEEFKSQRALGDREERRHVAYVTRVVEQIKTRAYPSRAERKARKALRRGTVEVTSPPRPGLPAAPRHVANSKR